MRENLQISYEMAFGRPPAKSMTVVTPTEAQESQFRKHGLTGILLPLSGNPEEILIDVFPLGGTRFAWLKTMRNGEAKVIVSDGRQPVSSKRIETPLEESKKWFITVDPEKIEGIHAMVRYSTRVGSKRTPNYKISLDFISR